LVECAGCDDICFGKVTPRPRTLSMIFFLARL
jgi:hypothetical protein